MSLLRNLITGLGTVLDICPAPKAPFPSYREFLAEIERERAECVAQASMPIGSFQPPTPDKFRR